MNNSYEFCKLCAIKVPQIHSYIHTTECHGEKKKKKKAMCRKLHPYIKDGEMLSQIQIILNKNSEKKNEASFQNWLIAKEPGFMKSFEYEFTGKFAFFSEYDICHSHIPNFSAVQIQVGAVEGIFIAVAESSNSQPIGTVRFYEKAVFNYFPIPKDSLFVTVKKINTIEEAKKICLRVENNIDKTYIIYNIIEKYVTNESYGWPYLFKKNGELKLRTLIGEEFYSSYDVDEEDIEEKFFLSCSLQSPFSNDRAMLNGNKTKSHLDITSESFKNLSLVDETDKLSIENSDTIITETQPKRKKRSFIRSSTPASGSKPCKRSKNDQTKSDVTFTPSEISSIDSVNETFYWLSDNTKIEIVSPDGERQTNLFVRRHREEQRYETDPSFYKNEQYFSLRKMVNEKLKYKGAAHRSPWSAILLLGLPGSGKTMLVNELCADIGIPLITATILDYSRSSFSKAAYISDCYQRAINCAPSVLFFDQFDVFSHSRSEFNNEVLKILQLSMVSKKPITIIGATESPELISPHMRQARRFDKDIYISLPTPDERCNIIMKILNTYMHNINREELVSLNGKCIGFSPADIDYAFRIAYRNALRRYEERNPSSSDSEIIYVELEDLKNALTSVVPSHLRDAFLVIPSVSWEDIWGYEDIKAKLKEVAKELSSGTCSKGILLYGPPGCSKTMMAKALAKETQFSFFSIKCSDLLSKYVGETEKSLNERMEKAFLSSPSIIFMDEIDSLCGRGPETSTSDGCVIPELISVMKKAQSSGNILFVGATNRPHVVDENLLTAGYFELLLHIDLPDCSSRCAIWEGLLRDRPKDSSVHIQALCKRSEGFTCAEICSIYHKAGRSLIESYISSCEEVTESSSYENKESIKFTQETILDLISKTSPRTSKYLMNEISKFTSSKGMT